MIGKPDKLDELAMWMSVEAIGISLDRSVAQGILSLAGNGPVRSSHVEQALAYARDAGMSNLEEMRVIGEVILRFEATRGASFEGTPELPGAPRTVTGHDDIAMVALEEPPPEPANTLDREADTGPSLEVDRPVARGSGEPTPSEHGHSTTIVSADVLVTATIPTPTVRSSPSTPAANEPMPPPAATSKSQAPMPRPLVARSSNRRALAIVAVVGVAGAVAVILLSSPKPSPPPMKGSASTTPSEPTTTLTFSGVEVRATVGWLAGPELAYRGNAMDPDESMVITAAPLPPELSLPTANPAALLAATRTATRAIAARLSRDGAQFELAGCGLLPGKMAGTCQGVATLDGITTAIETYLRVVDGKAVVAIVAAKRPRKEARREAAAMIASIKLAAR